MPVPCLPGTYKSNTGAGTCSLCPEKKPCPYYGLTTYEIGLFCAPGHYCPAGTRWPNEFPCDAGKFSDRIDITSSAQCETCPAKYACYQGTNTLTKPKVPCAPGFYCPAGTQYPTQFPCDQGTYSPNTDNFRKQDCTLCPPGKYCETTGLSEPTGLCIEGYYCPAGSISKS